MAQSVLPEKDCSPILTSSPFWLTQSGVLQIVGVDYPSRISITQSEDGLSVCVAVGDQTERFVRSAVQAISVSALPDQCWIDVDGRLGIPTEVIVG